MLHYQLLPSSYKRWCRGTSPGCFSALTGVLHGPGASSCCYMLSTHSLHSWPMQYIHMESPAYVFSSSLDLTHSGFIQLFGQGTNTLCSEHLTLSCTYSHPSQIDSSVGVQQGFGGRGVQQGFVGRGVQFKDELGCAAPSYPEENENEMGCCFSGDGRGDGQKQEVQSREAAPAGRGLE